MSRKMLLVAQREFVENVRTKAFWIGILMLPIVFCVVAVLAVVFVKSKSARTYSVLDQSGSLLEAIDRRIRQEDVRALLSLAAREGAAARKLPEAIAAFVPAVQGLDRDQLEVLSRRIAPVEGAAPIHATVPDEARAAADAHGTALLAFLDGLGTDEARALGGGPSAARFVRIPLPGNPASASEDGLAADLEAGRLFAYFVIGPDPVGSDGGHSYVSNNQTDDDLRSWFARHATEVVRARRFLAEGVEPSVAERIQEPVTFESSHVSRSGEVVAVQGSDRMRQFAPMGFCYFLYIAVMVSASMLVTNTIEEKSNRVIEVLLSSVSPLELMTGKILGIALTGLAVVGSWVACFVGGVLALLAAAPLPPGLDLRALISDPLPFILFIVYFTLGYLLYAAILVAVGSVCNSLKEAQNLMAPINIVLIIPLVAIPIVSQDPNGIAARVLSFIPLFTPFVMMNRMAGPPAAWEYAATTAVLLAAVALAFWMAAKIFRVGILMTGKPPRLVELWQWVRQPVGAQPERRGE